MKFLKSFLSIALLLVFLSSSIGVQVYKHYCGDFLEGISLYFESNPCADEGGEDACSMGKETSCCDDEFEFLKLEIDLIKHSPASAEIKYIPQELFVFIPLVPLDTEEDIAIEFAIESPPQSKPAIYKLLQRYTYYG